MKQSWKNRIVGHGTESPDQLLANPQNWRTHPAEQKAALGGILSEVGLVQSVIVNQRTGYILDGHARVELALKHGQDQIPVVYVDLSEDEERLVLAVLDPIGAMAGKDEDLLRQLLDDVSTMDAGLQALLDSLAGCDVTEIEPIEGLTDDDAVPALQGGHVSRQGHVWILGAHRVMCGDSTNPRDVSALMGGEIAQLVHADPPYGMGKQADGVANDNLYREKLDQFQMDWWAAFRPFLADNASAYIWGNAPDLWRLWYVGGLGDSEKLELRNEIVWDKKAIPGMKSDLLTQYPEASERCLFFQIGDQHLTGANINTEDFPEEWEGVLGYLSDQAKAAGIVPGDVKRVCGCGMYSHWFTKSQFTLIPEKHYSNMAQVYPGHFTKPWAELKAEWDRVRAAPAREINAKLRERRSYFDNAHDSMRDVWEFPRVTGDERHTHATPKPVAMMERVMRSSLAPGGLCVEPFGGSGATLMGAEKTGRRCFTMEMQEIYVDVIVRRWQEFTGLSAVLESTGQSFADVEANTQPVNEAAK